MKDKGEKIVPFVEKERTKCPFYGFCYVGGGFVDLEGNQCPFIGEYSPCKMEIPDWENCPEPREGRKPNCLESIGDCKIFPKEFTPFGEESWEGIPFKKWVEYIMKED
jgi:hypothetical protein